MAEPPILDALISRVGRGDRVAFAELYDLVAPQMLAVTRRVCRDSALAEEAVQEALLNVWQTAATYQPGRVRPQAWLCTIAHRRAVDIVRSESARRAREERSGVRGDALNPDPVSEAIDLTEDYREVTERVLNLTDLQREAIELTHYRGHTYSEAALLLDIPVNTVKTRVRDAVVRLRRGMEAR